MMRAPDPKALERAARYRRLAEEIRATMDLMQGKVARDTMLQVAKAYELLARQIERRAEGHSEREEEIG